MMGIQRFCLALAIERPLVEKIFARCAELIVAEVEGMVQEEGVGAVWITDDLGFNSGTFVAPEDLEALVFPTYREIVRLARARDLPVILHSCGKLDAIIPTLIDCGINALHSLPPNLYDFAQLKADYGNRLCLLGNIDVDLLSRGTPDEVRAAVRWVRDDVFPGGGIILSSSNSVPDYCKAENYLAMMDEARKK
jgi:uroporphyrinogen decarboxylase